MLSKDSNLPKYHKEVVQVHRDQILTTFRREDPPREGKKTAHEPAVLWVQQNYNTPVEHTPGNPPSPLWKESLYSLLVKV